MGRTGYALAEQARAQRLEHAHQSPREQTADRAAGQSPMSGPRGAGESPRAAQNSPGPVAEGVEDPHVELSRFSLAASVESCDVYGAPAPMLISRYERNPPPETVEGKPGLFACMTVYKYQCCYVVIDQCCSVFGEASSLLLRPSMRSLYVFHFLHVCQIPG